MNTRVIIKSAIVFLILVALSGCSISVDVINPDNARDSDEEVQAPTDTPSVATPRDKPLPTATNITTVISSPTSIPTIEPNVTPSSTSILTVEPTIVLLPIVALLQDEFDNQYSAAGQNPNIWDCNNCGFGNVSKDGGSARLEFNNKDRAGYALVTKSVWKADEIDILQGKSKMDLLEGGPGSLWYGLWTPLSNGRYWQTFCGTGGSVEQAYFNCGVAITTNKGGEYSLYETGVIRIETGSWHTGRIEIIPDTFELKFYKDNKLIGHYLPKDAPELLTRSFAIQINFSGKDHFVGHVDDILLGRYP